MALCGYDSLYAEGCVPLLTLMNRLNATVFGFAPDVIFSVDSAAKRAVAISGVTAGIGLVLNFWYQFLYNGVTAAKFQVRSHYCVLITFPITDAFTQGSSPRYLRQLLFLLPLLPAPDLLHADILSCAPRFHVLRFVPSVATGRPGRLFPGRNPGHSAIPLVWRASVRAWYPLGAQEDRCGLYSTVLTEKGGGTCWGGERWFTKTDCRCC